MKKIITLITLLLVLSFHPTAALASTTKYPPPLVTAAALAAWTKVAICEEGGWKPNKNTQGPIYYGNLGWKDATWLTFKRPDFPRFMNKATIQQQVWAAMRFAQHYGYIPDQYGCDHHGY